MPLALRLAPILAALAPPLCWSCRSTAPAREPLCRGCRARLRFLGSEAVWMGSLPVWAAVAYEGPARDLVRGLKYRGAAGLAEALAAQMAANAPSGPRFIATLVPVPAAPARVRRRGFDQAALLAAALGRRRGVPVSACLARRGGVPQVGKGRGARMTGLVGAIEVRSRPPPVAVLVDDVVTTGATVAACASELREGGCECVAAIAYARTLGR